MKKELSLTIIEKWLKDSDCDVRAAAMNACQKNGIKTPITRTIEPPKLVYKKCLCGIIVVAEIPEMAQIRGSKNAKYRASEAIIIDIIGDICGERIGISKYDPKTMYEIGDRVIIDDFDYSDAECSTGFHFFCTKEEAENY